MRLTELNIVNVDAIESYANGLVAQIKFQPAKKWFFTSLRKLLINDEKYNNRVAKLEPNAPEWLKKKYNEKVPLYTFAPSNELTQKLNHIVDWLNSVADTSQEKVDPKQPKAQAREQLISYANKILGALNSIDLKLLLSTKQEKVKHHVDDWFDALNKFINSDNAATREQKEGQTTTIEYDDGCAWVKLTSKKALEIEGKNMGHCVGGYHHQVERGDTQIFSLRDNEDMPHATLEISDDKIKQVKGKSNRPPVGKYAKYVKDFLNKSGFPPYSNYGSHDIEGMGLYYNPENKKYGSIKEIYKTVATSKSGIELLAGNDNNRPIYYLYKNDATLGTVSQGYGDTFSINLGRDEKFSEEIKKEIYDFSVKFLNDTYKNYNLENSMSYGYARKSEEDKKYYPIDTFKPLDTLAKNHFNLYKIFNDKSGNWRHSKGDDVYIFTEKSSPISSPILVFNNEGDILSRGDRASDREKPSAEEKTAVLEFFNKDYINETLDGDAIADLLGSFDIIKGKDGKYNSFLQAATPVKELGDGGKLYSAENTYRVYDSGNTELAEWILRGHTIGNLYVASDAALRKYSKALVEYFNTNETKLEDGNRGYHRYSSDKHRETSKKDMIEKFRQSSIVYRGTKWFVAKQKGADEESAVGWTIEKVGPKKANIISPNGKRAGELEFEKANEITKLKAFAQGGDKQEEGRKLCEFLTAFNKKHNKLIFYPNAAGSGINEFGYLIHNGKFMKIDEAFPTSNVVKVENGYWRRAAKIAPTDKPDSYKYGFIGEDGEPKIVVYTAGSDPEDAKTISQIAVLDVKEAEDEQEYGRNYTYGPVNMAPYIKAFAKLFDKEKLEASTQLLSKGGMQLKDGKIISVEKNPKLKAFVDGKIEYDDGARWSRDRKDSEWTLYAAPDKKADKDKEVPQTILTCEVDEHGISQIRIRNTAAKKQPKKYRKYLNDLMDIIDEMNAG